MEEGTASCTMDVGDTASWTAGERIQLAVLHNY